MQSGRNFPGTEETQAAFFFVFGYIMFRRNVGKFVPEYTTLHLKNTIIFIKKYIYQQTPRLYITDTHWGKFCSLTSFEQMTGKEVKRDLLD